MRSKTLLFRRHLIHYWHLSNQTTFHKTLFPTATMKTEKLSMENMLPASGSFLNPRKCSHACEKGQNTFQREPLSTMLWLVAESWKAPLKIAAKLFRKLVTFHEREGKRCMAQDMDEYLPRERIVDRRTHSPLMCASSCGCYCITFINLYSLISNESNTRRNVKGFIWEQP